MAFTTNLFYDRRFHKKYLWLFRIQLLAYLLHHDASVIMNDIDAMWVQDPYKTIFANHPDISIFAQRGAFPGIFKRKWGAAACMGFIYFRATEVRCVMWDNSNGTRYVCWAGRFR